MSSLRMNRVPAPALKPRPTATSRRWQPSSLAPSSAAASVARDTAGSSRSSSSASAAASSRGAFRHPLPPPHWPPPQSPFPAGAGRFGASAAFNPPASGLPAAAAVGRRARAEAFLAAVLAAAAASALWLVRGGAGGDGELGEREGEGERTPSLLATSAAAAAATAPSATPSAAAASAAPPPPTPLPPQHQHSVSFRPRWFTASVSASGKDDLALQKKAAADEALWDGGSNSAARKPYDVSVRAIRGGRFTMEDEYFVADGGRFAAVFDGHGGSGVAQYLKRNLYPQLRHHLHLKHWEESDDDALDLEAGGPRVAPAASADGSPPPASGAASHSSSTAAPPNARRGPILLRSSRPSLSCHVAALRAAFDQVERDVMQDDNLEFQGSTAVAVVVYESDEGHRTLLSANVGDSRAVLSRNGRAVELTHDHKPNDEKEKARIMALGETIEWDQDCKVHRVRNLSLARAIGDRYAKPAVSPEVEIQHFPVAEDQDEFVVIASDGLWDVMSSQDAVTFVHQHMSRELQNASPENADNYRLVLRRNMAKFLAREAIRKGSSDNVSVLLVWL